jgi:hypothetical protein
MTTITSALRKLAMARTIGIVEVWNQTIREIP